MQEFMLLRTVNGQISNLANRLTAERTKFYLKKKIKILCLCSQRTSSREALIEKLYHLKPQRLAKTREMFVDSSQ